MIITKRNESTFCFRWLKEKTSDLDELVNMIRYDFCLLLSNSMICSNSSNCPESSQIRINCRPLFLRTVFKLFGNVSV